jgi:pantothenate kinase
VKEVAVADLPAVLLALSAPGQQSIVGVVGPPGVGKSTFSAWLAAETDGVVVPMDGFHLDHRILVEIGEVDRKGAPFTFDSWGFANAVNRIRSREPDETVYLPRFDRAIENAVAGSIGVQDQRLVVIEGNYLLLDQHPWSRARAALDVVVYLDLAERSRMLRLMRRHVEHGRSRRDAAGFIRRSDNANAEVISPTRVHSDYVVSVDGFNAGANEL